MIAGLDRQPAGECFRELDDALVAMGRGDVVLNGHAAPNEIPDGATVWHFENAPAEYPKARNVWTFSERQSLATKWRYVPVGYHPSMERFPRSPEPDIDVIFCGCMNGRRAHLLGRLVANGLRVVFVRPGLYGAERDALLSRSRLALNVLFYSDGMYPGLRAAHLVANHVPMVSEIAPEIPRWAGLRMEYHDLEKAVVQLLREPVMLRQGAELAYDDFRRHPLELPP